MPKYIRFLLCNAVLLPIVAAESTAAAGDMSEPRSLPTLSKASVFSTILALWICCLTLPYGALLVPRGCSWLLRLSPISAALESLAVIYCLLLIPLRLSRGPAHDGSAMEIFTNPPQAAGFGVGASHADEGLPPPTPAIQPSPPGWRFSHGLRRYRATACALLLFRSRKYSTSSAITNEDIESQFNSNKIRRVDILATISVSFIFIKLCVISGAPLFAACGFIYICSWVSVQALSCLVHWNGSDFTQPRTVRECFQHVSRVDYWSWWVLLRIMAVVGFDCFLDVSMFLFPSVTFIAMHMVITAFMVIASALGCSMGDLIRYTWRYPLVSSDMLHAVLFSTKLAISILLFVAPLTLFSIVSLTLFVVFSHSVMLSLLMSEAVQGLFKKLNWQRGHSIFQYRFAMYELFVVVLSFWLYFLLYLDEGTTKPEWLEWIGV